MVNLSKQQEDCKNMEVKPIELVLMNMYHSNTYKKKLTLATFWKWAKGLREIASEGKTILISVFVVYQTTPSSSKERQPRPVFYIRPYGRFIEIKSNLRRKKPCRTNQSPHFLRAIFSNRGKVRPPIQFRGERQTQHLKR